MSLPNFSTQAELFSTAGISASLFAQTDRYRFFAKLVYPPLAAARASLEKCYCPENGRVAIEPVLMLGVSILQYLDGVPDRQAVEMLRYHAGWNFALNRQLGDAVFHPSSLVNFRNRLVEHQQSALGFTTILSALEEAGLVSRQSRQRLDSTQMFGRVARMSRLDCVRETLRLALKELEGALAPEARPVFWGGLWERYVESQTDYRAGSETLARKLAESGADAWQLLEWLRQPARSELASGAQAQLLERVFAEQFEVPSGKAAPTSKEKIGAASGTPEGTEPPETIDSQASPTQVQAQTGNAITPPKAEEPAAAHVAPVVSQAAPMPKADSSTTGQSEEPPTQAAASGAQIQPKDKKQLASDRVQNPHDPEATYAVKGKGEKKKEHVGFKVQVAETVTETVLAPGEPTDNYLTGILSHPAYQSDEEGAAKMEEEQQAMGLEKPPVQYVDAAYISARELVRAAAEGRELIGPAPPPSSNDEGRFTSEQFNVMVERRKAVCPAGKENSQCSRLEEKSTGKISYRFEWDSSTCGQCPLRRQCFKSDLLHRTLVVGEHHTLLQERRLEQKTESFKERMRHRNAIEGTQSELVRAHGLRHARYRGLAKAKLQNYLAGAACNIKRWVRRAAWELKNSVTAKVSAAPAI